MAAGVFDPGSFRDPLSKVFRKDGAVYRGLRDEAAEDFERLEQTEFYGRAQSSGSLVSTARTSEPMSGDWAAVLAHETIDPISYPYEWTFAMLKEAALLQLRLTREALHEQMLTKDASSYNVQFVGTRPTFIDIGSFERLRPAEPWRGYDQFGRLFLYPLVAQAVAGVRFQPLLRGSLDGLAASDVAAMIHGRRRLDRGLLLHVRAQARAQRRLEDAPAGQEAELRAAGFGPKVLDAQLASLQRLVERLRWEPARSTWSDYAGRSHYTDEDLRVKEGFVERVVSKLTAPKVLDIGTNDGRFAELAVEAGARSVIAVDSDPLVVDRLYRRLHDAGSEAILPLVVDMVDPSAARGWRSQERPTFVSRVEPDLVLCLAVVHHLALTHTVPFDLIVEQLADFGCPVVVELPHADDPMVRRLLARKRAGSFTHYGRSEFEAAVGRRFRVSATETIPSGTRTLYLLEP